jgi:glucose/mannose-6-phosphate isomerase
MKQLITQFPAQLTESLAIATEKKLNPSNRTINNVVMCGMGGSGIGASILSKWIEQEIDVPVIQCQNYVLPKFVSANTLVIGSSYSGNTEETLSAVKEAHTRGARIIGITSGGMLKTFCDSNGYDTIIVPGGLPPRSALAYSIAPLMEIFVQLEFVSAERKIELAAVPVFLATHQENIIQQGKEVASLINNSNAVIYSEVNYEAVAIRGKQQINENGKFLCRYHVIPEMNHNELVGWACGNDQHAAIFLANSDMYPSNRKRFDLTKEIIAKKTAKTITLEAEGANFIERSMYLIHLLDWASYYLGMERNEDVVEVRVIDFLKAELAK